MWASKSRASASSHTARRWAGAVSPTSRAPTTATWPSDSPRRRSFPSKPSSTSIWKRVREPAVLSHGYLPGIYCSSGLGNFVATKVPAAVGNPAAMSNVWIFDTNKHQSASVGNPFPTDQAHDPKMSGFAKATAWQYAHKHFVRVPTTNQPLEVDLNTSIRKDPGRPGP